VKREKIRLAKVTLESSVSDESQDADCYLKHHDAAEEDIGRAGWFSLNFNLR
jgi:hypothetical protein